MKYFDRIQKRKDLVINEDEEQNYLQPTEEEINDFLESGTYYGKCKKCNQTVEVKKYGNRYICIICNT